MSSPGVDPPEDKANIALVVVHGMGRQRRGETLMEWAEPLLLRIDHLVRRGHEDDPEYGVVLTHVSITGDGDSMVRARVTSDRAGAKTTRSLRITEARWSESFLAMKNADVFNWGAGFVWKALWRMALHFSRTVFLAPVTELVSNTRAHVPPEDTRSHRPLVLRIASALALVPVVPLTGAIVIAMAVALVVVGLVVMLVLPFLGVLLLIPALSGVLKPVVEILVEFVGDVGVWREKPVRAAAMREVVHTEIDGARRAVQGMDEPVLAVLAHSQGAAVTARVLFSEYDHSTAPHVTSFSTVGAAVMLLGNTRWSSRSSSSFVPVTEWLSLPIPLTWNNYWAIWDPFSAGPIADSAAGRFARWRQTYGEPRDTSDRPRGPAEHPVHSTAQPLTDHQSYADNVLQVVDPIARELIGVPGEEPPERQASLNRRHVMSVKSKGVMTLSGVVLALTVALAPLAQRGAARAVIAIDGWISGVVAGAAGLVGRPVTADLPREILIAGGQLTPLGDLSVGAAIVAIVTLVAERLRRKVKKALEWQDAPAAATEWIWIEGVLRFGLLAATASLIIAQLAAVAGGGGWALVLEIAVAVAATAAFISPYVARVPRVIPEERGDRTEPRV